MRNGKLQCSLSTMDISKKRERRDIKNKIEKENMNNFNVNVTDQVRLNSKYAFPPVLLACVRILMDFHFKRTLA